MSLVKYIIIFCLRQRFSIYNYNLFIKSCNINEYYIDLFIFLCKIKVTTHGFNCPRATDAKGLAEEMTRTLSWKKGGAIWQAYL